MITTPPNDRGPHGIPVIQRDEEPSTIKEEHLPSAFSEPDFPCVHCGHRTTAIDPVCPRCRGRSIRRHRPSSIDD